MVYYVDDNGRIIHPEDACLFKGKYYHKDDIEAAILSAGKTKTGWSFK